MAHRGGCSHNSGLPRSSSHGCCRAGLWYLLLWTAQFIENSLGEYRVCSLTWELAKPCRLTAHPRVILANVCSRLRLLYRSVITQHLPLSQTTADFIGPPASAFKGPSWAGEMAQQLFSQRTGVQVPSLTTIWNPHSSRSGALFWPP